MDKNILKIDLDSPTRSHAIKFIKKRLCYCHDIGFLDIPDSVKKIELITKSNTSVKIYLKQDLEPLFIVVLQLILGSDYRKEINTLINHFILNMEYSNRLFNIKKYRDGSIKVAKTLDVTNEVLEHIKDKNRDYYYN